MSNCRVCGGTEFYIEAGYYFCTECQTQNEEKREEILEIRLEGTRVKKRKVRKENSEKIDHNVQWTTWEQYNFVLIGLTDELIELGVTPELKLTVLQLWAFYLGKTEVAFTSVEKQMVPKLARSFHRKDADIIYGKLKARKRKRRKATSNSSVVSSQLSETSSARQLGRSKRLMIEEEYTRFATSQTSDSDATSLVSQSLNSIRSFDSQSSINVEKLRYSKHAKQEKIRLMALSKKLPISQRSKYQQKHVTTKYRTGPYVITPMKLWAVLYLALRIHKQDIHLADMLRYGREGHLSYYRLDHLLPTEMALTDHDVKLLTQNNEITHKGMRRTCADIAKFLFVNEINCPDLMPLISRYCKELNLPMGISTYVERLIAYSPPKMIFNRLEPSIPNYEGRAMAFIIVVLKVLLGLDGITEYETSRIAEKINRETDDLDSKLFSFREWQRYIECRRNILMKKHFPTKFKNDSDGFGDAELYVRFIKSALSRREEKPEIRNYKNAIPRDLTNAMEKCANMLETGCVGSDDGEIFPPSLTPQYSYLEQLLENPMHDLPAVLRHNFNNDKIYYLTKPRKLVKFAAEFGITLDIIKSRLHFVDKLVPQFEKLKMPSLGESNIAVTISDLSENGDLDSSAYFEKKNSQRFKFSRANQSYYDNIQEKLRSDLGNKPPNKKTSSMSFGAQKFDPEDIDFGFEDVGSDGKLAIPHFHETDSDNESVNEVNGESKIRNEKTESLMFYKKYNLRLPDDCTSNEIESPQALPKRNKNQELSRDINGRFVRRDSTKETEESRTPKSPRGKTLPPKNSKDRYVPLKSESLPSEESDVAEKLFIPSKDYWIYHCVFSQVKPKNFEFFESELPVSFQWLLNECADIVEMSTEDLYEQVCFVETHFAHILRPDDLEHSSYDSKDNGAKIRSCRKKW